MFCYPLYSWCSTRSEKCIQKVFSPSGIHKGIAPCYEKVEYIKKGFLPIPTEGTNVQWICRVLKSDMMNLDQAFSRKRRAGFAFDSLRIQSE